MSWMNVIKCGLLCAAAGAACGVYVAVEYNRWYRVADWERAAGYFLASVGLAGLVAGLVIGLLTSVLLSASFGRQLLVSLGIVFAVAWSGWAIAGRGAPPKFDGEELNLLVEFRSPEAWKPSNKARAGDSRVTLTSLSGSGAQTAIRVVDASWQWARVEGQRTILPADLFLNAAAPRRQITLQLGSASIVFGLPLPSQPAPENEKWSDWVPSTSASGTLEKDFSYRYRVERISDSQKRIDAVRAARKESLRKSLAALGTTAPLTAYLDFYRNDFERQFELTLSGEVTALIRTRPDELAPLLASPQYSLYALMTVAALPEPLPESYEAPLRQALPLITERIQLFRAGDPNDPDIVLARDTYSQFELWVNAWKRLGAKKLRPFPPAFGALQAVASGISRDSDLSNVDRRVKQLLAEEASHAARK